MIKYIKVGLILLIVSGMMAACGGTSTMPKRKKSRCNTCPKFSYLDKQYKVSDYENQIYS
ncbi:MAG: hypothetical protein IKT84_01035 [Bacteroidales bacterium]|nr:hypothetical protein [Bacteroidales bacterium]MBR5831602.1 hypothetical protein [Bacteroidales bacterium]